MIEVFLIAAATIATATLWVISDRLTEIRDELRKINRRERQEGRQEEKG